MIEAFNLDLMDDLRRRHRHVSRPPTRGSGARSLRLRAGRALIALGRRLDPGPARPLSDCA